MKFSNIRITYKLILVLLIAASGLIGLMNYAYIQTRQQILEERQHQLAHLIEITTGMISIYAEQQHQGLLSQEEAQQKARQLIATMRFDTHEYFFALDKDARIQAHGANAALIGQDMSAIQDRHGRFYLKKMAELANTPDGEGYFEYDWPRMNQTDPQPKLSYVRTFAPWGWVLGTGIYLDDLKALLWKKLLQMSLIALLVCGVLVAIGIPVIIAVSRTVMHIEKVLAKAAGGDLGQRVHTISGDELGWMGQHINRLLEHFQGLFTHLNRSSQQLETAAAELEAQAFETNHAVATQTQQAEQVAVAMQQITESTREVAQLASITAQDMVLTRDQAETGVSLADDALQQMHRLSGGLGQAAEVIAELDDKILSIAKLVADIEAISEQTNLLALNAAIESARAGSAGKGFAVVADEVRKLAHRSQVSTDGIRELNVWLSDGTHRAVTVMGEALQIAGGCRTAFEQARDNLHTVCRSSADTAQRSQQVAVATEEQESATRQVEDHLRKILSAAGRTREVADKVSGHSSQLSVLTLEMRQQLGRFSY